jgi:hypothetical protein
MSQRWCWKTYVLNIAAPMGLIIWRVVALPMEQLWKDWVTILAAYYLIKPFLSGRPAWSVITVATITLLLGIYIYGNIPYALVILGKGS